MIIADRRFWLTADKTRVVEDGDLAAAFLLASPGTEIPAEEAKRLGLTVKDGRVVLPGAEKSAPKKATGAKAKSELKADAKPNVDAESARGAEAEAEEATPPESEQEKDGE